MNYYVYVVVKPDFRSALIVSIRTVTAFREKKNIHPLFGCLVTQSGFQSIFLEEIVTMRLLAVKSENFLNLLHLPRVHSHFQSSKNK